MNLLKIYFFSSLGGILAGLGTATSIKLFGLLIGGVFLPLGLIVGLVVLAVCLSYNEEPEERKARKRGYITKKQMDRYLKEAGK